MTTSTDTKPAASTQSFAEQEETLVLALEKTIQSKKTAISRARKKIDEDEAIASDARSRLRRLRPRHPLLTEPVTETTPTTTKQLPTKKTETIKEFLRKLHVGGKTRASKPVAVPNVLKERGGWLVVLGAAIGLIAAFLYLPVYSDSVHYKDSQNWLVPYMPIAIFVIIALGILIGSVLGYLLMKLFTKQFPKKNEEHSVNPDAKQ